MIQPDQTDNHFVSSSQTRSQGQIERSVLLTV